MYPRTFDYLAPSTLPEALQLLSADSEAKILTGGMSLVPMLKLRLMAPKTIIDLGRISGLDGIEERDADVALGPLVRHADTATDPSIRMHAQALGEAAALTGDVQVRNWGTTCGSMAHADPSADQPAGALACGATLVAASVNGTREIAAADFFLDAFTSALEPDEVLIALRVPKVGKGEASAYEKVGRRGGRSDFAIAGAAVWVRMEAGLIADARVAITGVGLKPFLADATAASLIGTDGSGAALSDAAERGLDDVVAMEDIFGSRSYRSHLARLCIRKAAERAIAGTASE